ncbi:hypothetical protein Tco_1515503 [Tanacetum coccineum]
MPKDSLLVDKLWIFGIPKMKADIDNEALDERVSSLCVRSKESLQVGALITKFILNSSSWKLDSGESTSQVS